MTANKKPKFVSNSQESIRMFKSGLLNALSKVHFFVPLLLFVPVIGYFLYEGRGVSYAFLWFFGGLGIWTFTEYFMHRFVFHSEFPGQLGQRIHFIFHGVHHDYPNDKLRLVMPPSLSIPLSILFYFLFRWIIGVEHLSPFYAGFLFGYLMYDMMHYSMHHLHWKNPVWLKIKDYHMRHHYIEDDKGFGVSNPFWDYVFRTHFSASKK